MLFPFPFGSFSDDVTKEKGSAPPVEGSGSPTDESKVGLEKACVLVCLECVRLPGEEVLLCVAELRIFTSA